CINSVCLMYLGACIAGKPAPTLTATDSGQCCAFDAAIYCPLALSEAPMNNIDPALFEEWMMTGLVTILIIF
ncbi:hypothetical protein, partial [Salmonella enterica]|uniref:hypothetical protein n=1 Tax=Salmonella enterica TaxID=28901 RepID=UPI00329A6242